MSSQSVDPIALSARRARPADGAKSEVRPHPFRVLLDFDGTLVEPNVAILLVERFCPDGSRIAHEVDLALHEGRMTLREAWARQVALLPTNRMGEMVEFVHREVPLRPGARRLVRLLEESAVPTTIVSGGLDFFIRPILEREGFGFPLLSDTMVSDPDGTWRAVHPHGHSTCRLCGICKAKLAAPKRGELATVFVGDGSTDRYAAEVSTVVFARSRLKSYCERAGIPHIGFENLDTVADQIGRWLSGREKFPASRSPGRSTSECPISSALAEGRPYST
jgi:2-hydroxy-3-keto-5-methylthiopentenyl-1-phosphate phosphatase